MKTGLITALLLTIFQISYSQVLDTLGYTDFYSGSPILYTSPNGGYAFGNNGYNDLAKAQSYQDGATLVLDKVLLAFGAVSYSSADVNSVVRVKIYDNNGYGITAYGESDSIAPDSVLGYVDLPVSDILDGGQLTEVNFQDDTIVIVRRFSVGIDLSYMLQGDSVGLLSTTDGDAEGAVDAWEQAYDGTWFSVAQPAYSWGLDVDLAIFPVVDREHPAGIDYLDRPIFKVFPNPATEYITIDGIFTDLPRVEIVDVLGKVVMQVSVSDFGKLDVSDLAPGTYSVQIFEKSRVSSQLFIKH